MDNQSGLKFLQYLWPRHMDPYVLDNLRLRAKNEDIDYKKVIEVINETDAILSEYENASGSKESIRNFDKASNVFWNALSACSITFQNKNSRKKIQLTSRIIELLSKYNCSGIVLRSSSLYKANLRGVNLSNADLSGADLSDANLSRTNLRGINLRGADLFSADLREANLSNADLSGANLSNACLVDSDLSGTNLNDANMFRADLSGATLSSTDMRGTNAFIPDLY